MKRADYNVIQIVDYILTKKKMTNLRLQKILYFVQAFSLVSLDKPMFNEEINAWEYGPVVKEVYDKYKYWGAEEIPSPEYFSDFFWDDKDRELIDEVLEGLENMSSFDLVELTHSYPTWIENYEKNKSNKISKEKIKEYHESRQLQGRALF
ncbi:Panacea domain-containing protein [Cetobacterium sp.]|uniref:Panacea domain-containing protein n=1 Tax=Cetobacterium sp. TaxID=2071632 RepID=UPI003F3DF721